MKPKKRFQDHQAGYSGKTINWNNIYRVLSLLTLLLLIIKIVLPKNVDIEYLHILNLNYVNYAYIKKNNYLYSQLQFSN